MTGFVWFMRFKGTGINVRIPAYDSVHEVKAIRIEPL